MDELDWKKPALIGGLISGVPSVIPYVQSVNVCLCLWAWVGGIVAAKLLIGGSQRRITSKEGARIGLYAGLIAGVIVLLVSLPMSLWQMDKLLQTMIALSAQSPEAQSFYTRVQDDPTLKVMISFVIAFISAILIMGFTILGGLVGVALFEKRRDQPPPQYPPAYPPNYPPNYSPNYPPQSGGQGGDQGGWPQT
jgi:hypothetical protein